MYYNFKHLNHSSARNNQIESIQNKCRLMWSVKQGLVMGTPIDLL